MSDPLNIVYFPAAVALGALHALEPGHAKALTASYLIGINGTKRDSIVLGLSVAATHSLVVIAISAMGLWIGREAFAGEATHWLEVGSGVFAISIGSWMLWRRLRKISRTHAHREQHSHDSLPVAIQNPNFSGEIEIIPSPIGERMRFVSIVRLTDEFLQVSITRKGGLDEELILERSPEDEKVYLSTATPAEPHEFQARLFQSNQKEQGAIFKMEEPDHPHDHSQDPDHHHDHDHDHLDDIAHAKAHASTLPDYVKKGEHPGLLQIILFGAAGGMIPCPASITVMLLALSTGRAGMGIFTVLGFSLGLALALVGVGLIVVTGLSKLSHDSRFDAISKRAPVISAVLVIVSGVFALSIAMANR